MKTLGNEDSEARPVVDPEDPLCRWFIEQTESERKLMEGI
jgi:hypothetical protein